MRGIQVCLIEGPNSFPRGDNNQILIKLVRMHPWAKGTEFFNVLNFFFQIRNIKFLKGRLFSSILINVSFCKMRILNGTVSQVSDVAYWPLVLDTVLILL